MSAASPSQTLNGQSAFLSKFQGTVGQGSNIDTLDITGKQIKLTFYHTQTKGNEDSLKKIIMDFQAMNPGITIDAQSITGSYTGVSAKIRAGLQANQVPDIAVGYENDVANYQQADAVLDLTPYINSKKYGWTKEDLADIFPGFLDRNLYSDFKDQILSAPFTSSVLMMWYNNDMLKTLGFTGPAKTWDELKNYCVRSADPCEFLAVVVKEHIVSSALDAFYRARPVVTFGPSRVFPALPGLCLFVGQRSLARKCCRSLQGSAGRAGPYAAKIGMPVGGARNHARFRSLRGGGFLCQQYRQSKGGNGAPAD